MRRPRIDAFATQPHYVDHLAPIWNALPADRRGTFHIYAASRSTYQRARHYGIHVSSEPPDRRSPNRVLVAGGLDLRALHRRRAILVEHGAGQTYLGDPDYKRDLPSYAGSGGRDQVDLFICPRADVARLNLNRYPNARAVVASPRLEQLASIERNPDPQLVVVSRHWEIAYLPEMSSAWPHWSTAVEELSRDGRWTVALHAHPRASRMAEGDARRASISYIASWDEVVARAAVYAVDNSSTLYEAAWLGIPVVVLDAPWYRRAIEHGLRFWSHADVGPRPERPEDLEWAVTEAIERGPHMGMARSVFEHVAGSTVRVVEAVASL